MRLALDAYQNAAETNHTHDARPRIEHIETISAQDIPRFGKLGVIASFQPLHAYPDEDTLRIWARNAGPERASAPGCGRASRARRRRACLRQRLAGGDAESLAGSAECLNPADPGRRSSGRICAPANASASKTRSRPILWAPRLPGDREKTEGSLEPGKLADLIMLSQDLFKLEPSKVAEREVLIDHGWRKSRLSSTGWTG